MIMNKILHQITAEPETLWSGACPKHLLSRYHCKKRGCISFSSFRKDKKEKYTFNSMEIYSDTLVEVRPVYRRVQSPSHL